nr:unnamed protein product [Callosobruchus analis]
MAFLRTVYRCSVYRKYGSIFDHLQLSSFGKINVNQTVQKSSAASGIISENASQPQTVQKQQPPKDPLDDTFEDAKAAFKSKTNFELIRAYVVYTLCSIEFLVDNNMKKLFILLMKATFYGHFVAGEDQYKIRPVLERLRSFGVKPILDYSVEEDLSQEEAEKLEVEASVPEAGEAEVEGALKQYHVDKTFADRRYKVQSARTYFYLNEATCERNMETFIRCLEAIAGATYGTGITAVKLTALGRPQLLLQLSEVIMRARQYMTEIVGGEGNVLSHHISPEDLEKKFDKISDKESLRKFLKQVTYDKHGVLHLFPWSGIIDDNQELSTTFRVPDLKSGRMIRLITQLSPKEEEMFRNMIRRMNTIVKAAQDMDVRIMVDAEQTYFQPAITRITLEFMRKYNKDKAIVFNTYQCYLRNALSEVTTDLEQAKRQNFYFGAKLERARAAAMGYPDPTNPNFEATTEMYHNTLSECLRRIKEFKVKGEDKKIAIMVASHNEDTVRFAIQKMKEFGIEPADKVNQDTRHINTSHMAPRAHENKGVLKKIKKEKRLLAREILRRLATGQLWYTPKGNYE